MRVKMARHGNSLGVTIPAVIVRAQGLEIGQEFELISTHEGGMTLQPVTQTVWKADMTLSELLAGIPEEGLIYEDLPEYIPVGKEMEW